MAAASTRGAKSGRIVVPIRTLHAIACRASQICWERGKRMTILVLGLVIFLGLHSIRIVAEPVRAQAIARFGEGPWKGIYSLISAVGFILIVWGFSRARYEAAQLWTPSAGRPSRHDHFDADRHHFARGLFLQAKPHRRRRPSSYGLEHRHLRFRPSPRQRLGGGCAAVRRVPRLGVAALFSAYARDRRNGVVYPEPDWGATGGAVVVGLVLFAVIAFWLHALLFGVSPLSG